MKFKIWSIDALREPEGNWLWNDKCNVGEIEIAEDASARTIFRVLREVHFLSPESTGRVALERIDMGIEIQTKGLARPVLFLEPELESA